MDARDLADLLVLRAVAEQGSFTRAAQALGRSQPAVSQAIAGLEARLGQPLLLRSTRSLRPTEAGQRLIARMTPALDDLETALSDLRDSRDRPSGPLRITSLRYPAEHILMPALIDFRRAYPEVEVAVRVQEGFEDLVGTGQDAGVRLGLHLAQDVTALRIGPDMPIAVVAAPDYADRHGLPETLQDLARHDCIGYRLASADTVFRWQFVQDTRPVSLSHRTGLVVDDGDTLVAAALAGAGLAWVLEPLVRDHLTAGRLVRCLTPYCPVWPGYHLYYRHRKQKSPALSAFVDTLRRHPAAAAGRGG